ncbi:MAG: geranylgeranylglycerol-phosphate geranylgeranyltransferase [Candidatus Aenigmarchaeota archaeon]|nr:geranylgeranylglycerol-phosphate geranylgeranyltransferase [Candidatus Aenigmarchaeota archaeon]
MVRDLSKGLFSLIRPVNCVMSAIALPVAFVFLTGFDRLAGFGKEMLIGPVVVFFMCAGGNALNDVVDLRIDRINKPSRPIPSGMITKKQAFLFSVLMFLACIAAASVVSKVFLVAAVTGTLVLGFYDMFSKSLGVLGNMIVSLVIGSPFMIIGMVTGETHRAVFLAIAAAAITFGRELVKSIEDVKGDLVVGRFSLPAKYGKRKTMLVASASILVGSVSLIYLRAFYGNLYLLFLIPALYKFSSAIIQPVRMTPSKAGKFSKDIKTGSAITIIALLAGSLFV